jgi:hypothetical protein
LILLDLEHHPAWVVPAYTLGSAIRRDETDGSVRDCVKLV